MTLRDDVVGGQRFVDAPILPRPCVEIGSERLGQPVGERLDQNRVVVVVGLLEASRQLVRAKTRRHREAADVVDDRRVAIGDEVGE